MSSPPPCPRRLWLASLPAVLLLVGAGAAPPQYKTAASTDLGKLLVAERTDAPTLQAALQLTRADLTRYFGAAPSVFSAWSDSKDPQSGAATFLVVGKQGKVKGLVTCKVGSPTRVAVAYIRADATAAQWSQLVSPPPDAKSGAAQSGTATESVTGAQVQLRPYNFPDGTGSVGLADGWSTNARSATGIALLQGPKGEVVSLGGRYSVQTPASRLPRMPNGLVANYGSPVEVFAALVPQFNQMNARQGGPTRTVDHLVKVDDPKHVLASENLTVLRYGITETAPGGGSKHAQAMTWMGMVPGRNGTFVVTLTSMSAPDALFDKEKALMFQMMISVRTNDAAIGRKTEQQLAAQKRWFESQQQALHAQQAANEKQHAQYYEGQRERARSNDNFDEYLRGVRTVEDTKTGEKTSVDLGNSTKIVEDLNEHDPGRYREIPLRDEVNP